MYVLIFSVLIIVGSILGNVGPIGGVLQRYNSWPCALCLGLRDLTSHNDIEFELISACCDYHELPCDFNSY